MASIFAGDCSAFSSAAAMVAGKEPVCHQRLFLTVPSSERHRRDIIKPRGPDRPTSQEQLLMNSRNANRFIIAAVLVAAVCTAGRIQGAVVGHPSTGPSSR